MEEAADRLESQQYELSPDLVTLAEGRPHEAEAIRTIRTHIVARHLEDGRRGVAFCGATAGVGCTFTAVNLAVSLAQAGVATLLIDADLRTPQVESFIRPGAARPGLKDCIAADDRQLSDYIHAEVIPNLSIMYSGGVADNPQELLSRESFKTLIERCLRDFEFTIIDTTAANVGADEIRVARIVGYALIVAKAHTSRMSDVANLASQLQEDGARVIGSVLNDL
jgi:capsular exopolysaccharide synthesis family protein